MRDLRRRHSTCLSTLRIANRAFWESSLSSRPSLCDIPAESLIQAIGQEASLADIGCGDGRALLACRRAGHCGVSVGIDWSVSRAKLAQRGCPGSIIIVADARQLPLADGVFDACILAATLTCFVASADIEHVLRETSRVLRPGGVLCLVDFLITLTPRNIVRYVAGVLTLGICGAFWAGYPFRHYRRQSLLSALHGTGLHVLHVEEKFTLSWTGRAIRGISIIAKKAPRPRRT